MFRNLSRLLFGQFSWSVLMLEFLSIILAIFIGNLVTNWHEKSAKEQEAVEAVSFICEELEVNYSRMDRTQKYYDRVLFLMDSLEMISQLNQLREHPDYQGINPPLLQSYAYEMAQANGALAFIDFEQYAAVSVVYAHIESYNLILSEIQGILLRREIQEYNDWINIFYFLKQPTDLFLRDFPDLEPLGLCVE